MARSAEVLTDSEADNMLFRHDLPGARFRIAFICFRSFGSGSAVSIPKTCHHRGGDNPVFQSYALCLFF